MPCARHSRSRLEFPFALAKLGDERLAEMGDQAMSIDQDDRRRAPRSSCRLHCRVLAGKERTRARIVDVSDGGLCLLSPTWFASKSKVHISIDVPNRGESFVEAQVWHVRRQKMHGGTRKVWAIGVILEEMDDSYQRLLLAAGVASENVDTQASEPGQPTTNAGELSSSKPVAATQADSAVFQRRKQTETEAHTTSAPPSTPDATTRAQARTVTGAKSVPTSTPSAASASASTETEVALEDLIEPKIFRIRVKATAGPRTKVLTLAAESEEEARSLAIRDLQARWTIMEVRAV